jgi:hypothetical protein
MRHGILLLVFAGDYGIERASGILRAAMQNAKRIERPHRFDDEALNGRDAVLVGRIDGGELPATRSKA